MRGVSHFLSTLTLLFILISLFPIVYLTFQSSVYSEQGLVAEALSRSVGMREIRISFKRLGQQAIAMYNLGNYVLSIDEVYVDGLPQNVSIYVYNGSLWIASRYLPSQALGMILFNESIGSYVAVEVNGTIVSISGGE